MTLQELIENTRKHFVEIKEARSIVTIVEASLLSDRDWVLNLARVFIKQVVEAAGGKSIISIHRDKPNQDAVQVEFEGNVLWMTIKAFSQEIGPEDTIEIYFEGAWEIA